ncbi:MAG: hypothetical protein WA580_04940 [Acidimicrobiales bacterium]
MPIGAGSILFAWSVLAAPVLPAGSATATLGKLTISGAIKKPYNLTNKGQCVVNGFGGRSETYTLPSG